MNAMFKEIRHGDIEKIRVRIAKNSAVVNEIYTGTKPKKDIGQSPLQVAIKCGQFEIIDLLIENGADVDFMEDPALVPPHSVCMSVLHDAIIGVFATLCYKQYEDSEQYEKLINTTLQVFKKKISYRTFRCIISLRQPLQRKVIPYDKLIIQQRKPDW